MRFFKNSWLGSLLGYLLLVFMLGAAAASARAASVSHFGVAKSRIYSQSSATLPATPSEFGFQAFAYQPVEDSVAFGLVTGPGGVPFGVGTDSDDARLLVSEETYSTQAALDAARGNGLYAFQLFTSEGATVSASVSITGDAYPTASALGNFAAAQDVTRAQTFTLQWTKPAQLDGLDFVSVSISADGNEIFTTPAPWQAGALNGTVTSVTLPANLLPEEGELEGRIEFINVTARETQSLPGATGLAAYTSSVRFPLKVHGGGSGGDTTPPTLVSAQPASMAINVAPNAPVVFRFSEAMKPMQMITWINPINPINPANFVYGWSVDGRTLTCTYTGGFMATSQIVWQLNPDGFSDLAGNPLAGNPAGFFTTASGGTGPCENGLDRRGNVFYLARVANFSQLTGGVPTPIALDPEGDPVAGFFANFSQTNIAISKAEVVIPGGQRKTLNSQFGTTFFFETFPTEAALVVAYPNGTYTGELTLSGGAKLTSTITLGNGPNTPHCANFAAAQVIDPAAAFVLSWDAFSGPGPNDRIEITITDDQGRVILQLPDECSVPPKPLAVTATSITIPANLLLAAKTYSVDLTFTKVSDLKVTGSPAYSTIGAFSRTTKFNIKTIGGLPNARPVITAYRIAADGRFEADVTGSVGRTIKLEASELGNPWVAVGSGLVPASGKVTVRDSRLANLPIQTYRARSE